MNTGQPYQSFQAILSFNMLIINSFIADTPVTHSFVQGTGCRLLLELILETEIMSTRY